MWVTLPKEKASICNVRRGPMPVPRNNHLKGAIGDEELVKECEIMGVGCHEQGQMW